MSTAQLRKDLKRATPNKDWARQVDRMRDDEVVRLGKRLHDRTRKGR